MSAVLFLILRLAAAACLYVFLGWAFYTIWRELRHQDERQSFRQMPALTLVIAENGEPSPHLFHQVEVSVGRDPTCDIILPDESVSARHARFSYHHNQWWIEDLESRNGTRLNQVEILSPTVIVSGDTMRCGKTSVRILIG